MQNSFKKLNLILANLFLLMLCFASISLAKEANMSNQPVSSKLLDQAIAVSSSAVDYADAMLEGKPSGAVSSWSSEYIPLEKIENPVDTSSAHELLQGAIGSVTIAPVYDPISQKIPKPKSISIIAPAFIVVGETQYVYSKVQPMEANQGVKYRSSDPNIISVDPSSGRIKGLKAGTAKITAKSVINGKTASIKILVAPVKSIKFSPKTLTMTEGDEELLVLGFKIDLPKDADISGAAKPLTSMVPDNSDGGVLSQEIISNNNMVVTDLGSLGPKIKFSSSDSSIVKVDSDGFAKALKKGTATITAKYMDLTATCKITVKAKPAKEDVLSISFAKGTKTYATYLSNGKSIIANTIPTVNPGEKIKVTVSSSNNTTIKSIVAQWNNELGVQMNTKQSTMLVEVPYNLSNYNVLSVDVVPTKGKAFSASFRVKVNSKPTIHTEFSLNGTMYAQYSSDGTSIVAKTMPTAKAGVNLLFKASVDDGYIKSISYTVNGGASKKTNYSSVQSTKIATSISPWGANETSRKYSFIVTTTSGKEFSSGITVYKPKGTEITIRNILRNLPSIYEGDLIDFEIISNGSKVIGFDAIWDSNHEMQHVQNLKLNSGYKANDIYTYTCQVKVPKNVNMLETDMLQCRVTCEDGTSVSSEVYKYKRMDYEPEIIRIMSSQGNYSISIGYYFDETRVDTRVLNSQAGDTFEIYVHRGKGDLEYCSYKFNFEEQPTYFTDDRVKIQIPKDISIKEFSLEVEAKGKSGKMYYFNQPIRIIDDYKINADVSFEKQNNSTLFLSYASKENKINYVAKDNKYYENENVLIEAHADKAVIRWVCLFVDGEVVKGVGNLEGDNSVSIREVLDKNKFTIDKTHKMKVLVSTTDYKTYTFEKEFYFASTPKSDLTVDLDLSKTYDYDDVLKLTFNRPLKSSEWFGTHTINSTREYVSYNGETGSSTLEIPVYELLWTSYIINKVDYRKDPIRLSFTTGTDKKLDVTMNTHCNDNILKVTSRYMDEVDEYIKALSSGYGFYASAVSDRYTNTKFDVSDLYNNYQLLTINGKPIPMYPTPPSCKITFGADGTFTKTTVNGVNTSRLSSSHATESGTIHVNPAEKLIYFSLSGRSFPVYINRAEGFNIKELSKFWENGLGGNSYYVTFTTILEYDMPRMNEPYVMYKPGTEIIAQIKEHGINIENGQSTNYIRAIQQGRKEIILFKVQEDADVPKELLVNGVETKELWAKLRFGKSGIDKATIIDSPQLAQLPLMAGLCNSISNGVIRIDNKYYNISKSGDYAGLNNGAQNTIVVYKALDNTTVDVVDILKISDLAKTEYFEKAEIDKASGDAIVVNSSTKYVDDYTLVGVDTKDELLESTVRSGDGLIIYNTKYQTSYSGAHMMNDFSAKKAKVFINETKKIMYIIELSSYRYI